MKHSAMQVFICLALLVVSGAVGAHPLSSFSTPSAAMGKAPEGITAAEWKKMGAAIERDQYRLHPQGEAYYAPNHAQELHVTFTPEGFEVRPRKAEGQWRWGLHLRGYGYGDQMEAVSGAELVVIDNRVEYRRGDLVEWYVNDHRGLEQGFTLSQRPAGQSGDAPFDTSTTLSAGLAQDRPLQLHLRPTGDLSPRLTRDDKGIEWMDEQGKKVLRYSGLYAYDATGRELGASMEVSDGEIKLRVRDQGAVYPITIDPFIEQKKLTASDAAAADEFGLSVAISGDTAIVGAPFNDDNGGNSGSAYIFERNEGGADNWGEVKKLTASDAASGDQFGFSVAISGDTAIVGAPLNDDNGGSSGSAYIFERNEGGADNWGEVKKLTASDAAAGDQFGLNVAISGDTAIVGAPFNDDNGDDSGSAYIFERNEGGADNWGEVKKLTASDAAAHDQFGLSVAISGDTAIVGAHFDDDNGSQSGSAYIFERSLGGADNWGEVKKLTASDAGAGDRFGESVAISGDTAIVGAPFDDDNGGDSGSAYIFERSLGGADNWGEVTKLTASDAGADDRFGESVSISGDTAIIGAPFNDDNGANSGSAYIFERNQGGADNWGEVTKLTASDAAAGDQFGLSVAISGDTAIVGAHFNDDNGSNSGSAYVFRNLLPDIDVQPSSADYGEVVVSTTSDQDFTVENTGTFTLNVSATSLEGADAGQFSIQSGGGAFSLAPGDTRIVTVRFEPTSGGGKSATLRFASDDPDENPKDVPLSGTGVVHDLAVTKITAPNSVKSASPVTKSVKVEIQNRSPHNETVEAGDLGNGTSTGLVRLDVSVVDSDSESCQTAGVALDTTKNDKIFSKGPKVLKPKAKLTVNYLVTYNCTSPLKKFTGGDYAHVATVHHEVLDGNPDSHTADDTCPRSVTSPFEIDPNPDGTIKDKGCGAKKKVGGTFGAPVVTDVVKQ